MKPSKTRLPLTQDSDWERILRRAEERAQKPREREPANAKAENPSPDAPVSSAAPLEKAA